MASIQDVETGKNRTPQPKVASRRSRSTSLSPSSSSQSVSTHAFVDYVPPPEKPIPPPAVYKLVLIITTAVFFAEWVTSEAGVIPFLIRNVSLSSDGAILVFLGILVFVLVYGTLDLIIGKVKVSVNGKTYGIETWLKQPRIRWIHGYPNNFVMECFATVLSVLEDGFDIFKKESMVIPPKVEQFESDDENEKANDGDILLRIESNVKPDHIQDYIRWRERLLRLGARPGMKRVDCETTTPVEESPDDEQPHLFVTHILFESLDALNDFMASPFRERMLRKLRPLLVSPSALQLCQQRCLADAFTDLCHGPCVPKRNPKKWKVWILTTLSLWIVLQFTNTRLPPYLEAWGLVPDTHPRAVAAIGVLINVVLNSYVGMPFLNMMFGHWMRREEDRVQCDITVPEPWRTLNDGLDSSWSKLALTVAFYGGCTLTWILKID